MRFRIRPIEPKHWVLESDFFMSQNNDRWKPLYRPRYSIWPFSTYIFYKGGCDDAEYRFKLHAKIALWFAIQKARRNQRQKDRSQNHVTRTLPVVYEV